MGRLHDAVVQIDEIIADRGLDAFKTKGEISLKAGFFLSLIFENSPDEEDKIAAVKNAAKEVLGVDIRV
ncbi:MAG: hypothetical protein FDZ70_07910 [Actinobacteria bacterium]|nr:MAG: hypothetical protein FDZ70_07910 [Actinomycetota bacterium]